MKFIVSDDYGMQIRSAVLSQIKNSDDALADAEASAQTEMESYLRIKYDVAKIFAPVLLYDKALRYLIDQRIMLTAPAHNPASTYVDKEITLKDGLIYRAKAIVVAEAWTPAHWEVIDKVNALWYVTAAQTTAGVVLDAEMSKGDTRYPVLLMYLKDMVIYHIFSNISAQNIPESRGKRYDAAIKWLNMVTTDKLSPDLPLAPDQNHTQFKIGSNPKVTTGW
jgi:hypothetical protein